MRTGWASKYINTYRSFCTETKMSSCYNEKKSKRPRNNYSVFFFFFLFEEKGGCGRLVFYFKKIREKGYLVFTRGLIYIMHSGGVFYMKILLIKTRQLYTTTGVAKVLVLVCQEKMTKSDSSPNFKSLAHPRSRDFYLTSSFS